MNTKERKEMSYFPTEGLDKAVRERFGEDTECETSFNIIEMRHITLFKAKGAKKKHIEEFIAGYTAGNIELRDRMHAMEMECERQKEAKQQVHA